MKFLPQSVKMLKYREWSFYFMGLEVMIFYHNNIYFPLLERCNRQIVHARGTGAISLLELLNHCHENRWPPCIVPTTYG